MTEQKLFSENNKISGRQIFRLLSYDLLGIGTLLIPAMLAETAGRDGIFCILAGMVFALFYLKLLELLFRRGKKQGEDYLAECKKSVGSILYLFYFLYFVLMAAYAAYLFAVLVNHYLVEHINFLLILGLILLLSFYSMTAGIEGRARVYEILFWILMIPFFLMLLAACREVDTAYWSPIAQTGWKGLVKGSAYTFFGFSAIAIVPFLKSYAKMNGNGTKKDVVFWNAKKAVVFSGGLIAVLYLILLGMFGAAALSEISFPAVTMMSRVQITGGFLKRTDALMFGIWFFTLYAFLNSMVFYGGNSLMRLCGKKEQIAGEKKKMWFYLAVIVVVAVIAVVLYRESEFLDMVQEGLWKIATPAAVVLPVVVLLLGSLPGGKRAVKVTMVCLLAGGALFLQGCNTAELEDREFPELLCVREDGEFEKQWTAYEYAGNKKTDYNHLKVILVEKSFLENEAEMATMLTLLKKEQEVPWNTYVMATEDCDEIVEAEDSLDVSIGQYLEELLENTAEVKQEIYPTLGMLYQEQDNHLETMFLPYLTIVDKKPAITGYEAWKRGSAAGLVSPETALLSFLTQNAMREFAVQLSPEQIVKLTAISCEEKHTEKMEKNGRMKRVVLVKLKAEGRPLLKDKTTAQDRETYERQMADYFRTIAAQALRQGIDVTNSYKKLGWAKRDWYEEYQNTPALYEKDIQIAYEVKINWKEE